MSAKSIKSSRKLAFYVIMTLVLVLFAYLASGAAVYYWKEHVHHYRSGAVSCLYALHTMQNDFRLTNGHYADSFEKLGVPLGAKLTGDTLIWGGPYLFRLVRVTRSPDGSVYAYSIEARPRVYPQDSERSFIMTQDGSIYFTDENRPAVSTDRRIPPQK